MVVERVERPVRTIVEKVDRPKARLEKLEAAVVERLEAAVDRASFRVL